MLFFVASKKGIKMKISLQVLLYQTNLLQVYRVFFYSLPD